MLPSVPRADFRSSAEYGTGLPTPHPSTRTGNSWSQFRIAECVFISPKGRTEALVYP